MACREAQRRISFYRAVSLGEGVEWERRAVCAAIQDLSGADAYFDDGSQVNFAEVCSDTKPHLIRFSKVRRDELPGVDDAAGGRTKLESDEETGLIEAIHLCLFPNGVIGAQIFAYGPRISRFERFVNQKLELGPFEICELIRHDLIERALQFGAVRLGRVRLSPSLASHDAMADVRLDPLLDMAVALGAEVYADLTLRSEPYDTTFRDKASTLLRCARREGDVHLFDKPEIAGKPAGDETAVSLESLSEGLGRIVEIPYRAERFRDVGSDAAFAAIRQAYREVADELVRDGLR